MIYMFNITKYIKKTYNSEIATVQQERAEWNSTLSTAARFPSIKHKMAQRSTMATAATLSLSQTEIGQGK